MTTTLQDLKPIQIKPHPRNPRRSVGDVDELAASIAEQGVLEPLIVAPLIIEGQPGKSGYIAEDGAATGPMVLIAGHRRLAAAKQAKAKTVPCIVRDDLVEPAKQIEAMLVENLQRVDLTPVEEGEAYQQLLEFPGYTQKKIVAATGRTAATVRGRIKLTKLPDTTKDKIVAGQISLAEANGLLEFIDDSARYKRLERTIGTDQFNWVLADAKRGREIDRREAAKRKELEDSNVRVRKTIPEWGKYDQLWGDKINAHRDCPGFAAYISYGQVTYLCDQPELHRPAETAATRNPGQDRLDELTAGLEQAAGQRREFIAGAIAKGCADDTARRLLGAVIMDYATQYGGYDDIALLLSVATGTPITPDNDENDFAPALEVAISKLDLHQLVIALAVAIYTDEESALGRLHAWQGDDYSQGITGWRRLLTDELGYQYSPAELAAINYHTPEATDADDGQVDDQVNAGELAEAVAQ